MWKNSTTQTNEIKKEVRSTGEQIVLTKIVPANCCQNKAEEMRLVQLIVYVYGNPKFLSYTKKKIFLLKDSLKAEKWFQEEKKKIEQKYALSKSLNNKPVTSGKTVIPNYVTRNTNIIRKRPCGSCGGSKKR